MKKSLLKLITLTFSILFVNTVFSQSDNWEEYYSDNQIKIEYNYMICDFSSTASQELIVFRFTNLSENNITLNYENQIWYDGKEINTEHNSDEFRKTINLENNEIITTNCENQWKEYSIFSAFVHNETNERYVSLTKFELINITTKND
ncbi:MAG: hypothetical protein HN427_03315 [Flavobacteriales bacterium]|jgi:hypothetical protein|nr:hypothetical protein [Flavobacteriales bacterium]MBT6013931.1 hypothetical protein [Flavobacteriales bacterium]MBT7481330.1 hypothetical protein [Flavobacteriales bacterium]